MSLRTHQRSRRGRSKVPRRSGGPLKGRQSSGRIHNHHRVGADEQFHLDPCCPVAGASVSPRSGGVVAVGPTKLAAFFLGVAIALVIAGLTDRFALVFSNSPLPSSTVPALALLMLAIGVRVPQRVALWICAIAWRRFVTRGGPAYISVIQLGSQEPDRPLYWVVLAVIALGAGLAAAFLPFCFRLTVGLYDWMLVHFFWSVGPLAVLQAGVVLLTGLLPLTVLGLAVSCVHHLSCPYGRWETRATAWVVVGAAVGVVVSVGIIGVTGRGDLAAIAAALPALLVSLISATSSAAKSVGPDSIRDAGTTPLPLWSDRWSLLLRVSIVAVGGAAAYAVVLWIGYVRYSGATNIAVLGPMLLALGVGVAVGCRAKRSGFRSIGGFGVACVVSGMVAAVGSIGLCDWVSLTATGAVSIACVNLVAIGAATAYGRQALLVRVANRSAIGASILAQTLVCAALVVWIGEPVMERLTGRLTGMMVLALSLLALGGSLIIHEPSYSPRTRRIRLQAVFGSIGALILLLIYSPNAWREGSLPGGGSGPALMAIPTTDGAKLNGSVEMVDR